MTSERRGIYITGMGIVSAAGDSVPTFFESLREGKSGISPIEGFDVEGLRNARAGEVKTLSPKTSGEDGIDRAELFARMAARQAVEDAGLRPPLPKRTAVVTTTNFGGLRSGEDRLFKNVISGKTPDPKGFSAYAYCDPAHRL